MGDDSTTTGVELHGQARGDHSPLEGLADQSPPEGWSPEGLDTSHPTPARMYDYYLGGKNNFPVDRAAAEKIMEVTPGLFQGAWENRRFIQRAVRFLAAEGIDQFLDLGAGLPTQGNVHEIAQSVNPKARVVYVDSDPLVLAHGRAILAENDNTTVVTADIRDPEKILSHPDVTRLLDFSRPVAVLCIAVMHFIRDEEDPRGIIRTFRDVMAPGSHLVLSHVTIDGLPAGAVERAEAVYANATSPAVPRPLAQVEELFTGFDLLEPGLVRPWRWRPDDDTETDGTLLAYAGVARLTRD